MVAFVILKQQLVLRNDKSMLRTLWKKLTTRSGGGGGGGAAAGGGGGDSHTSREVKRHKMNCGGVGVGGGVVVGDTVDDEQKTPSYRVEKEEDDDAHYEDAHDDDDSQGSQDSDSDGDDDDDDDDDDEEEDSFHDSRQEFHLDVNDLIKTHYPDFDDELPDVTAVSDEDEEDEDSVEIAMKEQKYATKVDQDVAVFLAIAEHMSLKSLLHLLQGHVRSNAANVDTECYQQYAEFAELQESSRTKKLGATQQKPLKKQKQFRFAEITDHQVRVVVHEIDSVKHIKDLWWKHDEMQSIRHELIDAVQFYRKHRRNYINSVEIVARGNSPDHVLETHMKYLTNDTYARGLESHVVRMLSENRSRTVKAVLAEQDECRLDKDNYETTADALRDASLVFSSMSTKFATRLGQCDEIDALKANMSRWENGVPANGSNIGGAEIGKDGGAVATPADNTTAKSPPRRRRISEPPIGGFFDARN